MLKNMFLLQKEYLRIGTSTIILKHAGDAKWKKDLRACKFYYNNFMAFLGCTPKNQKKNRCKRRKHYQSHIPFIACAGSTDFKMREPK